MDTAKKSDWRIIYCIGVIMAWIYIIIYVIALIAAYALMPKPQSQPPPGIDSIKTATAEEGREIPVLFGTKIINSPNIVWYGNFRTVAVKKKAGKK